MQTIDFPRIADREMYRLVDVNASTEAAAALREAATRAPHDEIVVAANAADRDRMTKAVASADFPFALQRWIREMREIASAWPDSGACTVATALRLWSWTFDRFPTHAAELAQILAPLLAARCYIFDVVNDKSELRLDFANVFASHAAAQAGTACAEIVYGYRRHLQWDAEGCATCYAADDLDDLESIMPGIASGARVSIDIIEADGSHPAKRGPCATFDGVEPFVRLRNRLDACLSGSRIAKDRAAAAIARRP